VPPAEYGRKENFAINTLLGFLRRQCAPVTVTENRRQFLAAAIVFASGLIAVVVMSGDPGAEIWHQIKHLIKH